jgi:hypothetical protein
LKTVVATGASGELHRKFLEHTAPLTQRWAKSHGYEFVCARLEGPLPPSWHKIDVMLDCFASGCDEVLWVDSDVAVLPTLLSPFSEMEPHHKQGLVLHRTECGDVPNCGVWAARSSLIPDLKLAMEMVEVLRENPWWEQSAVMQLMGFIPSVDPGGSYLKAATPLYHATKFLHPRWNWHPADANACDSACFYHITQRWSDEGRVKQLASIAEAWG